MMGWMAPLRHLSAKLLSDRNSSEWEPSMGEVTTIGLDLAKHVFQVHGVDAEGATVLRKQLRRAQVLAFFSRLPPCFSLNWSKEYKKKASLDRPGRKGRLAYFPWRKLGDLTPCITRVMSSRIRGRR